MTELTVPDVLGIHEGDTIEMRRGGDVLRGVYSAYEIQGESCGPDLITEWIGPVEADLGLRVPVAYIVERLIELGWTLNR